MLKRISIIGAGNLTQALLYSIDNSSLKMDINLYDKDKKKDFYFISINLLSLMNNKIHPF